MSPTHPPVRRLGALPAVLALTLAVLALLTGCSSAPEKAAAESSGTVAVGTPSPGGESGAGESGAGESGAGGPGAGESGAGKAAAPAKVDIPSLGISSSLMDLGLNEDGTVEVPPAEKGMTAGWYTGGAIPGEAGAAVIIGHNDTRYGKAVFHDLKKITKGAAITVTDDEGAAKRFTVKDTESVSKNAFPTDKVYGRTDTPVLRLITCDGDFDAEGHPVNNLIVYATPA
ncbi:class F sortase [Streptomyces sp. NPDC088124]|uniref:class F sortase n=1 Tax=Streptomyces sp. NPDC088124 TaxID=3154654 RepID=UPI003419428F